MKSYNTIYFLLLVLLVLGAFASMAQNSYGMAILGVVATSFSLLFFYRLFSLSRKKTNDRVKQGEVLCLGILGLLISLRIFNIHGRLTEPVFTLAGLVLAIIYLWKMYVSFSSQKTKPLSVSVIIPAYYLAIALFLFSMITFSVLPLPSFILTVLAFLTLIAFLALSLLKRGTITEGEPYSALKQITGMKDQSLIVMSLFVIFSLHTALSNSGILPKLYSDHLPQAYYRLLKNADTREEIPVNGKYRHDAFKKEYDVFVQHHLKQKD